MILAATLLAALMAASGSFVVDPGAARQPGSAPSAPPAPVGPASSQTPAPPLAEGPAPDLALAFTAQVIGWIEPCG